MKAPKPTLETTKRPPCERLLGSMPLLYGETSKTVPLSFGPPNSVVPYSL
jgi:hypothetical protein